MKVRVGLEFHQRLESYGKLFCSCDPHMNEKVMGEFFRVLRPRAGEKGLIDPAAMYEFLKGSHYTYQITENACLVEFDEEPPHPVNKSALKTAIKIAKMLHCKIPKESYVMRKIVLDGSNVCGFQRTMLIGLDGYIDVEGKRIEIDSIYLEEESAGKVKNGVFRLDRLGIPLVEISTGIIEGDPGFVKKVALTIGKTLRLTGEVQRGIGTIRQDVNVSIPGGARIEIKGVQDVDILDKIITLEIERQRGLLKLRDMLKERDIDFELMDVTEHFRNTRCNFIKKAIRDGARVYCLVVKNGKGIFGFAWRGGRFGKELAGIARAYGLGGIIHSDEDLTKYHIDFNPEIGEKDGFILIVGKNVEKCIEAIEKRILFAKEGVPEETRRALPDGTTEYMRPLPGSARMYPETDHPPVPLDIEVEVPETLEERRERLVKLVGEDLGEKLLVSRNYPLFEKFAEKYDPKIVAVTLEQTIKSLRRAGFDTEKIDEVVLEKVFEALKDGKIAKEAIPDILKGVCDGGDVEKEIERFKAPPLEEVKKEIEALKARGLGFKAIMGAIMKKYRGKIDGKKLAELAR